MNSFFEKPQIVVEKMEVEDIITASGDDGENPGQSGSEGGTVGGGFE